MKNILLILTMLICSMNLSAQNTAEDSVKNVINTLFSAMKSGDTKSLKNTFAEGAIMQTVAISREGSTRVRTDAVEDFIRSIASIEPGSLDERITYKGVYIDGALASVWTPYEFYFKGQYLHRGANSFQLVRLSNGWKIQYIIDTRRKK